MAKEYIDNRDGGYRIIGTRVSLDSVICAFLRGVSPEGIAQSFPVLSLEEVYGAITYYLGHQDEVDSYLQKVDGEFEDLRAQVRQTNPALHKRLTEAKQHSDTPRR